MPYPARPIKERIAESVQVNPNTGCWIWQKSKSRNGYGKMFVGSKRDGTNRLGEAHRVAYEAYRGPIPAGLECDHLCRRRDCVNPDHIELVTHMENMLRGNTLVALGAYRKRCRRGHPLAGDNLVVERNGTRRCRACRREADSRRDRDKINALARERYRKKRDLVKTMIDAGMAKAWDGKGVKPV